MKSKKEQMLQVAKEIENCDICKKDKIGIAVVGEGSVNADIMFVGEAPGRLEAEVGRPFIGRSGKLLRSTITSIGLNESRVYITSPVKYLPTYITPTSSDILHGKSHFDKQVEIIDPKLIVLLGRVASEAVLNRKISVVEQHGKVLDENGRKMFVTVHPAASLRFTKMRNIFKEDFEKLKEILRKQYFSAEKSTKSS